MSNCIVCESVIKDNRKGKKYCSIKCKQRAYHARKNGEPLNIESNDTIYSYKEYKTIIDSIDSDYDVSFIEYCFIRSFLPKVSDEADISELVEGVLHDAYNKHEDSALIYITAFENYKSKLYKNSLKSLD